MTAPDPNSAAGKLYAIVKDMTDSENSGVWFWLKHDEFGYVPAKYVSGTGKNCIYESLYGETLSGVSQKPIAQGGHVFGNHAITVMSNLARTYYDMVHMDDTNEASILHNVRLRFDEDQFMTNVGSILVLVNPFQWFEHLYTLDQVDKYRKWRLGDPTLDPHVYQIGERAYRGITEDGKNQAIIISGESGAGKTEATKKVLQYLAAVAGHQQTDSDSNSQPGIESKLLAANPVLEAFGNAKTVRNNNSSRFGKWMELQFDTKSWSILGCSTLNYLLEKVRLVRQSKTERNFHVFYQFLSPSERALDLRNRIGCFGSNQIDAKSFRILYETSRCVSIHGMNDGEEFDDTYEALQNLEFDDREIEGLFRILTAILFLGNITFVCEKDSDYAGSIEVMDADSAAAVKAAATALQISPTDMVENLIAKMLYIGDGVTRKSLEPPAASEARDSMIKGLYGKMFDWIVRRVNKSLNLQHSEHSDADEDTALSDNCVVGVLDIFGFEIFEHNSFEQLCINFANEKLQQHFNRSTFKDEQALYKSENIPNVPIIKFADNQDLIHMMEKSRSPPGLLVMLDEEVRLGQSGSDAQFLKKLGKVHKLSSRVRLKTVQDKKTMRDSEFWVNHYAGDVKYDVNGFLSKNRDELFRNIQEVLATSQIPLVHNDLFNVTNIHGVKQLGAVKNRNLRGSAGSKKIASLGGQFRLQLIDLMNKISSASPHYIRCIKPNPLKRPRVFDARSTLAQLRCSGVFEAVEIRKQGFPFRLHHNLFYNRYVPILKKWIREMSPVLRSTKRDLILGVQRNDPDMLKRALDNATSIRDRLELPHFCTDESKIAEEKLEQLQLEFLELDKLRDVIAVPGEAFCGENSTDDYMKPKDSASPQLRQALEKVLKFGVQTARGKLLISVCELLLKLRPLCASSQWMHVMDMLNTPNFNIDLEALNTLYANGDIRSGGPELVRIREAATNDRALLILLSVIQGNAITSEMNGSLNTEQASAIDASKNQVRKCELIFEEHQNLEMSPTVRATIAVTRDIITLRSFVISEDWNTVDELIKQYDGANSSFSNPARDPDSRPELAELRLIREENFRRQVLSRLRSGIIEGRVCSSMDGHPDFEIDYIDFSSVNIEVLERGLAYALRSGKYESQNTYIDLLIERAKEIRGIRLTIERQKGISGSSIEEDIIAVTRIRQWVAEAEHDLSAVDTALEMLIRVHERADENGYDHMFLDNFYQRLQDMEVIPNDEMMAYNIVDVAERTVRIRGNITQRPLLGSLVPPNIQLAAQSLPLHHPDRDAIFKLHDTLLMTKIALAGGEISENEGYRGSDTSYLNRPATANQPAYDARSIASSEWSVEARPPSISGMSNTGNRKRRSNNQNNHSSVRPGSHPKIKKDSHTNLGADNSANFEDESDIGSLNTKSEVAYTGDSAPPSVFSDDHLSLAGSATSELKELSKDAQADELLNMLDGLDRNSTSNPREGEPMSSDAVVAENSHRVTRATAETERQRFTLRVDILSCSDLRNADGPRSKSDPYVVVKIGQKKGRSRTVKNDLHPIFNDRFDFIFNEIVSSPLHIEVWDKDFISDDRLGHIEPLDVQSFDTECKGIRHELDLPLVGNNAKRGSTVRIALEWRFSEHDGALGKVKEKVTVTPVPIPFEDYSAEDSAASRKVDKDSSTVDVARPPRIDEGGVSDDRSDEAMLPDGKSTLATENAQGVLSNRLMIKSSDVVEAEQQIATKGIVASSVSRSNTVDDVANNASDKANVNHPVYPVVETDSEGDDEELRPPASSPKSTSIDEMSIEARIAAALAGGDDTSAGESSGVEGSITGGGSATDATDDWDDDDLADLMA
eukprot:g4575.t1